MGKEVLLYTKYYLDMAGWISSLSFNCKMVDDDEVGDEYANCKPSSTGESFCNKKSDKCIPDQPGACNCDGHAGEEDDHAS